MPSTTTTRAALGMTCIQDLFDYTPRHRWDVQYTTCELNPRRSRRNVVAKLAPAALLAPLVAFADEEAPPPPAEAVADAVEAVAEKIKEAVKEVAARQKSGDGGYCRTCENFRTEWLQNGVCVPRGGKK